MPVIVAVMLFAAGVGLLAHGVKVTLGRSFVLGVIEVFGGVGLVIVGLSIAFVFST